MGTLIRNNDIVINYFLLIFNIISGRNTYKFIKIAYLISQYDLDK